MQRPVGFLLAIPVLLLACESGPTEPGRVRGPAIPAGWFVTGTGGGDYEVGLEWGRPRTGGAAAYLASTRPDPAGFVALAQNVRADEYRGRRVRWAGWVRADDIRGSGLGLWMRVDGPGVTLAFDNMFDRAVVGTTAWHEVSVVLDVPGDAIGIAIGVLLSGPGDALVDDFRFEVVGADVASTGLPGYPREIDATPAEVAAAYDRAADVPVNLGFEGLTVSRAAVEFLAGAAAPFETVIPRDDDRDLEPLRRMVGDARVVGLGEGTHGTREFFQLKHRIVQFLVREMGFTHFAIEATWPESNAMNRYVLTGEGDPARLLSELYFWTWNTQEVRSLVDWMRAWNRSAPPDRQVRFLGFDMQYPGAAMDTVLAFVARVDPPTHEFVAARYACLDDFRNDGPAFRNHRSQYAAQPQGVRDACRAALQEVHDRIEARRAPYEAAASPSKYEHVLRSARVVQQFEDLAARSASTVGALLARDAFMAENTIWLLDQAGPDARMVLWAHNYHVSRLSGAQGDSLARAYGDDYVNLGFLFGTGGFNAVGSGGAGLREWAANRVRQWSVESAFLRTGEPRLLFDTRVLPAAGPAAAPLRGPIPMRSIGATFEPARELEYYTLHSFPRHFDLLMFVNEATATTLLPFVR